MDFEAIAPTNTGTEGNYGCQKPNSRTTEMGNKKIWDEQTVDKMSYDNAKT
jgi:hypothetical protein